MNLNKIFFHIKKLTSKYEDDYRRDINLWLYIVENKLEAEIKARIKELETSTFVKSARTPKDYDSLYLVNPSENAFRVHIVNSNVSYKNSNKTFFTLCGSYAVTNESFQEESKVTKETIFKDKFHCRMCFAKMNKVKVYSEIEDRSNILNEGRIAELKVMLSDDNKPLLRKGDD